LLIVILIASKTVTVCFNKTGNNRILKNKQEITITIVSYLSYTIYNSNKYQYYLPNYLTTFMCRMSWKSGNLNLLEPSGPHWACYGTPLPLSVQLWFF